MILIIVYVGAVAVLFLFVVMMLDINLAKLREGFLKYLPVRRHDRLRAVPGDPVRAGRAGRQYDDIGRHRQGRAAGDRDRQYARHRTRPLYAVFLPLPVAGLVLWSP